ncbi:MAG TPA: DNA repair protein RecN [Candidatus Binataceae bacterium]|nr:DNA repair protein RecN [Candidatus Binataceae bacterium]
MLLELRIRNFALIEQAALEFAPGLNVLSGETGAGKTIIMTALGLLLGMRASPDLIRAEQKEAAVEGRFELAGEHLSEEVRAAIGEHDELLVRRTIAEGGRSRVLINDSLATVQSLSKIGGALVQIYGQHEQQSLLRTETHLAILDRYGALEEQAERYRAAYTQARAALARLAELRARVHERQRRLELARFELAELEQAQLDLQEASTLAERRAILANASRLGAAAAAAEELIASQDGAAIGLAGRAQNMLLEAVALDPRLGEAAELIAGARLNLEEAAHLLQDYAARIETDPARLEQIDNRIQELNRIKRKYGGSLEEAIAARERARAEVAELENFAESQAAMESAAREASMMARAAAEALGQGRRQAAARLCEEMTAELRTLEMRSARFEVRLAGLSRGDPELECDGVRLGPDGAEEGEFYLAPNLGAPAMALARIASGGELSRVMLALKRLEARQRGVATLIFDEVDAGIGGAVAQVVGRKLKELARYHQVLCVTHLPQIASFADRHFLVEKEEVNTMTVSRVSQLDGGRRVEELARMLGGEAISERFRRAARELLARAQQ